MFDVNYAQYKTDHEAEHNKKKQKREICKSLSIC